MKKQDLETIATTSRKFVIKLDSQQQIEVKKQGDAQKMQKTNEKFKLGSGPRNYEWYQTLKKPKINPPQWVFPIVWTILYILIGISFYFYLRDTQFKFTAGIIPFCIQLILNFLWTPIFFWKKMITLALVDIVLMWGAILVTITMFFLKSPIASYLLIPYILWVSLATYLNAYIVRYNEDPSRSKCKNQQKQ